MTAVGLLRTLLDELGLVGFLKTTGGKGLHVVLLIRAHGTWDEAKAFTHAVAEFMVRTFGDWFTATASKARRKGKIFIDYLRNAEGATRSRPVRGASTRRCAGGDADRPGGSRQGRASTTSTCATPPKRSRVAAALSARLLRRLAGNHQGPPRAHGPLDPARRLRREVSRSVAGESCTTASRRDTGCERSGNRSAPASGSRRKSTAHRRYT